MKFLYIQDKVIKSTDISLSYQVGKNNDFTHVQGIAHWLEHLMFLGSKKYKSNTLYKVVSSLGGVKNASTSFDTTNYIIHLATTDPSHVHQVLEVLADMHINPALKEDKVNSEVNNIESEFNLGYTSEARRIDNVVTETMDVAHPFKVFGTGNTKTLRDVFVENKFEDKLFTPRNAIVTFWMQYYNPSNAHLVISSSMEYNEMLRLVRECYMNWSNKKPDPKITSRFFFNRDQNKNKLPFRKLPKIVEIQGVTNGNSLVLYHNLIDKLYMKAFQYNILEFIFFLFNKDGDHSFNKSIYAKSIAGRFTMQEYKRIGDSALLMTFIDLNDETPTSDAIQYVLDVFYKFIEYLKNIDRKTLTKIYNYRKKVNYIQKFKKSSYTLTEISDISDNLGKYGFKYCLNPQDVNLQFQYDYYIELLNKISKKRKTLYVIKYGKKSGANMSFNNESRDYNAKYNVFTPRNPGNYLDLFKFTKKKLKNYDINYNEESRSEYSFLTNLNKKEKKYNTNFEESSSTQSIINNVESNSLNPATIKDLNKSTQQDKKFFDSRLKNKTKPEQPKDDDDEDLPIMDPREMSKYVKMRNMGMVKNYNEFLKMNKQMDTDLNKDTEDKSQDKDDDKDEEVGKDTSEKGYDGLYKIYMDSTKEDTNAESNTSDGATFNESAYSKTAKSTADRYAVTSYYGGKSNDNGQDNDVDESTTHGDSERESLSSVYNEVYGPIDNTKSNDTSSDDYFRFKEVKGSKKGDKGDVMVKPNGRLDDKQLLELYKLRYVYKHDKQYKTFVKSLKSYNGTKVTKSYTSKFEKKYDLKYIYKNIYLPKNFKSYFTDDYNYIKFPNPIISKIKDLKVYQFQTSYFSKYIVSIRLNFKISINSMREYIYYKVLVICIKRYLFNLEEMDLISEALYSVKINNDQRYLSVIINGFNENILVVFDYIIDNFKESLKGIKETTYTKAFKSMNARMMKSLLGHGKSHNLLSKINRTRILTIGRYDSIKTLSFIKKSVDGRLDMPLSYSEFTQFVDKLDNIIESKQLVVVGDYNQEIIKEITDKVVTTFPNSDGSTPTESDEIRVRDLRNLVKNKAYMLNKYSRAQISLAKVSIVGYYTYKREADLHLLNSMLNPYLFNHLRSEKGIGYVVKSKHSVVENVLINTIVIVGKKYNPIKMRILLEESLDKFRKSLESTSTDDFYKKRDTSYSAIEDGSRSLNHFETFLFKEVRHETYDFARYYKVKNEVSKIDPVKFLEFYIKLSKSHSYTLLYYPKRFSKNWDKKLKKQTIKETKDFFAEIKEKNLFKTLGQLQRELIDAELDFDDGNNKDYDKSLTKFYEELELYNQ